MTTPDLRDLRRAGNVQVVNGMVKKNEIRFTPPLRASLRMAGFVIPLILSLNIRLCLFAPPFPNPFPPFPRPDMMI